MTDNVIPFPQGRKARPRDHATRPSPLTVTCPFCYRTAGNPCVTRDTMRTRTPHQRRYLALQGSTPTPR